MRSLTQSWIARLKLINTEISKTQETNQFINNQQLNELTFHITEIIRDLTNSDNAWQTGASHD